MSIYDYTTFQLEKKSNILRHSTDVMVALCLYGPPLQPLRMVKRTIFIGELPLSRFVKVAAWMIRENGYRVTQYQIRSTMKALAFVSGVWK